MKETTQKKNTTEMRARESARDRDRQEKKAPKKEKKGGWINGIGRKEEWHWKEELNFKEGGEGKWRERGREGEREKGRLT